MQEFFSATFWQAVLLKALEWIVTSLPSIALIVLLGFGGLRLLKVLLSRLKPIMIQYMRSGRADDSGEIEKRIGTLLDILGSVLRVVLSAVIGMLLLRKLGVDIAPLIAGAGIVGLAIGFGAQELVRDCISGFFMLMENQVRVGDFAVVNGKEGLVERIGLRTIVLRDISGTVHVFQNGKVISLSNMSKEWSAYIVDVSVAYQKDIDAVIDIMKCVFEEMCKDAEYQKLIIEPIEIFGVDSVTESSVLIKARLKTKPLVQWMVGREYRRRLKKALDAAGI